MPELRADPDLRRLAERADSWLRNGQTADGDYRDSDQLRAALSPDRVLALLDRLAALEEALRVMGDYIAGPMAAWVERNPCADPFPYPPDALAGTPKP